MSGALSTPPGTPAELHGDLTIQVATDRKFELIGLVDGCAPGSPCVVDVSQIIDVDSAGVQLLIALRRSLAAQGSRLELAGTRGALAQALATYRLDHQLGAIDLFADQPHLTNASAGAHA
jgi:ABC-type transporter Mla MlaB component